MSAARIPVKMLGQSGCMLRLADVVLYVDPYLSNSVQELDAPDLARLTPIPFPPESVTNADWVLLTHEHIDHCDPQTIPKLAVASPQARFLAPQAVVDILRQWGISEKRIVRAEEHWLELSPTLKVRAIPAAHPEIIRDMDGNLRYVGYLLDYQGKRIYFSGDTFARQEILDVLVAERPVHIAFLPVNEHNFFRERRGIVGNMSVREAFKFAEESGAEQVVAVHWDMFAANAVDPEEIRFIHRRLRPAFRLLIQPTVLNLADARISIVIRTLNEAGHLEALLTGIAGQEVSGLGYEVVLVDSGSTDGTVEIAERHGCIIRHISREEFSFGRSLNIGCEAANGEILVFISGHCVPVDTDWLQHLCQPLLDSDAEYTYGRQYGGADSHFSEHRIFGKYYPESIADAQSGFFCNNANAALLQCVWAEYGFDEDLTGLEDLDLGKRLLKACGRIRYVPDAAVYHYHSESWRQVRRRFEREAIALQHIMPQLHVSLLDTVRYVVTSIWLDCMSALRHKKLCSTIVGILRYRYNQYLGSHLGNHLHRKLSHAEKEKYFYPE